MRRIAFWLEKLQLNFGGFATRRIRTELATLSLFEAKGSGDAPPLLLLHGVGGRVAEFGHVLQPLRRLSRRVLAPDLPGHGVSGPLPEPGADPMYRSLCELIEQTLDEQFILVGNSLGGGAALRYVVEHPDRVLVLVLVSPAAAPMSAELLSTTLDRFQLQTIADARGLLPHLFRKPPWIAKTWPVLALIRSNFLDPQIRGFVETLTPADLLTAEQLASVRPPTLVIWGRHDTVLPRESLAFLRQHLPAATQFIEPENAGHCMHFDAPAQMADLISDFVRANLPPS